MVQFWGKRTLVRFTVSLGVLGAVALGFQNCSKVHFAPVELLENSASSLSGPVVNCQISGPSLIVAGSEAGPYTVNCEDGSSPTGYSWACAGSEAACHSVVGKNQSQFFVTPATFAIAESAKISVNVSMSSGARGSANKSLGITVLPPSAALCGYTFRLGVDIPAVTGGVAQDLKNAATCRCQVNAAIPGLTLVSSGRYRINGTNDEVTMTETPIINAGNNTATCKLTCADSEKEPSVDPKGNVFCSACKVPATIVDNTGTTPTWEFVKDDTKKACFYQKTDAYSAQYYKNPANYQSIQPTFKKRDPANTFEPTMATLGFSPGSVYHKFDPATSTYTKFNAADYVPNCSYHFSQVSFSWPGYTNPNLTCDGTRTIDYRVSMQDQMVAGKLNARYFWCYRYDVNSASGDCNFCSGSNCGGGGGGGGGSGGGYQ